MLSPFTRHDATVFTVQNVLFLHAVSTMFHILSLKKIEHYRVSFCISTYSDRGLVCDDQESWINTDSSHTWSWKKLQELCVANSGMLKSDKRKVE